MCLRHSQLLRLRPRRVARLRRRSFCRSKESEHCCGRRHRCEDEEEELFGSLVTELKRGCNGFKRENWNGQLLRRASIQSRTYGITPMLLRISRKRHNGNGLSTEPCVVCAAGVPCAWYVCAPASLTQSVHRNTPYPCNTDFDRMYRRGVKGGKGGRVLVATPIPAPEAKRIILCRFLHMCGSV